MVEFNLWTEALIFGLVFAPMILIPCVLVALMGRKMIDQLGLYPSNTPIIQMSILWRLVGIELVTFCCLIGFFQFFSGK